MKILHSWYDDHLPCIEFEHEGKTYDLCWTHPGLIGKLELVEDGTISLEKAMANYPGTLNAIITNEEPDENEDDIGTKIWYSDAGCLTLYVNGKKQ